MNALAEVIRREISDSGPISFARFMELALYCPNLGYYEQQAERVGRTGDFFTSVSVGSLFGELLAYQFAKWLAELKPLSACAPAAADDAVPTSSNSAGTGAPLRGRAWQIVEAGAHDGRLAADVLGWLRKHRPGLLANLAYWIIEPSVARQEWQQKSLHGFEDSVHWVSDWRTLGPDSICGVIFANELLDSFPVHRIAWDSTKARWFEWGVTWENGEFVWYKLPEQAPFAWPELSPELRAALPDGFTTEIGIAAPAWWKQAAAAVKQGKLLTIDYGLTSEEFLTPARSEGTLRAYRWHHLSSDLLAAVGEQDLTSHLNFTLIQAAGERAGLKTEALIPQSNFLTGIVAETECTHGAFEEWTPARIRQLQTLIHPEHLGRSFRVLIQSR